jgi:hypothetical protein
MSTYDDGRETVLLSEYQRLRAIRDELLAALELAESVYRQNVVVKGEPSAVLDAMQAAIKKAKEQP